MYIIHDGENYKYQFSLRQGGIDSHVYCSVHCCLCNSDILSIENTRDLQGISIFYESDTSEILVQDYSQIILVADDIDPSLTQIDNKMFGLKGNLKQAAFIKQIPHILYTISESSRQLLKAQCTIHAAGVSIPSSNSAILILGDKGSGKTSTAFALCQYHGAELIGNDLVIIGNDIRDILYLHGGTTGFTFRKHILDTFFSDISLEQQFYSETYLKNIDYEEKITISPSYLNIIICKDKKKLSLTIRVNVHAMATSNSANKIIQKPTEALRLHENFARYIRGQTTPLMLDDDGKIFGYLPSLDSCLSQNVRHSIISLLLDMPFYYITAQSPQQSAIQVIRLVEELGLLL